MDPATTRDARRTLPCPRCSFGNLPWATACHACGTEVRTAPPTRAAPPARWAPTPEDPVMDAWKVMGIGAFLAPALGLVPILQYMGWFLASLVHEMGHCVASWLSGMPAYPAIRIDGHAAAMHSDQKLLLVLLVWGGLAWLAWQARHRPRLRLVACAAVALYPLLAFTESHELLHLLAGHGGELAFAGVFFYRGLSGGFTESVPERITYACCAWYLLGRNIVLDVELIADAGARATYASNGSFGLTQDFIRAARQLGWSLEGVAALMLLLSIATLPLAWWAWRRLESPRTAPRV